MANMSYCRFQNTLRDLQDCYHHFDETEHLSEEEKEARTDMIELAVDIAIDFGDEINMCVERV